MCACVCVSVCVYVCVCVCVCVCIKQLHLRIIYIYKQLHARIEDGGLWRDDEFVPQVHLKLLVYQALSS